MDGDGATRRRGTRRRHVAANALIQAAGDLGGRVGQLVLYAVMARVLGASEFGEFALATSLALFVLIAAFGMDYTVTRQVAQADARAASSFVNALGVKLVLGLLIAGAVIGVAALASSSAAVLATAVIAGATLADLGTLSAQAVFRGVEDAAPISKANLLQRWAQAAGGVAVLLLGGSVVAVSLAWLGGSLLACALSVRWLLREPVQLRARPSRAGMRAVLADAASLGMGAVFGGALARLDVVVLGLLAGATAVGLYGGAYRIFESLLFVTTAFALATLPALSRLAGDGRAIGQAVQRVVQAVLFVSAPIAAAFVLVGEPVVRALYGPSLAGAGDVLALLAPAFVLTGLFNALCSVLAAVERQGAVLRGLVAGAVVNLAGNLVLIGPLGPQGAAVAMSASMLVTTGLLLRATLAASPGIRWAPILLAPLAGCGAMGVVVGVAGASLTSAVLAGSAYVVAVLAVQRSVFPEDLRALLGAARGGRPVLAG